MAGKAAQRRRTRQQREELTERLVEAAQSARSSGFVSGLKINLGSLDEEYVPKLKSWTGRVDLYEQMGNDAKIAAQLRANILPLISAVRWKVEGGTDEQRNLVSANLLRQGDPRLWCETSWVQRLFESLMCLKYGVSLFGKTWDVVDGWRIYRQLTYLHPRSLGGPQGPWEWNESGTRLVAVHRAYTKPGGAIVSDERIPIEDIFPVVWWMAGENWEGVSLLRSMYRAFTEKDLASKIQMVDLQNRGVGIPDGELGPTDGAKEASTMAQQLKDLRGGSKERQWLLRGNGQKISFLTSQGTVVDASPIIQQKNNEFAAGAGTDFQQQGQTATGSRATGSVLMVSYMQELDATRKWIEEQFNHGAGYCKGLAEELQDENFGDVEEYAYISGSCVSPTEQLDNIPNIVDAVQRGSLIHDLEVENHVRKGYGLKAISEQEFTRIKSENKPIPNLGGRPDSPTPTDVEEPRDDDAGRAFGLAEKKTAGAKPLRRNGRSYGWLVSKAS